MKITKTQLSQLIKEELAKVLNDKVFTYSGDAQELIDHAESLGWEFIEDKYVDADGYIDWDKAMGEATAFLEKLGVEIEYN